MKTGKKLKKTPSPSAKKARSAAKSKAIRRSRLKTKRPARQAKAAPLISSLHPALKDTAAATQTTEQIVLDAHRRPESAKFDTAVSYRQMHGEPFRLPSRYYDDRITAMTRDPWWIHAYWDISDQKERQVIATIPADERQTLKRILRIYDVTGIKDFTGLNARGFFDIEINDLATNWYINVDKPDSWFCIDIGFRSYRGGFYLLARSNITKTPSFGISSILDEEWYLPDDEYFKMLGIYDLGKSSLQRRRKLQEIFRKQISSLGASESFSPMQKKKLKKFFLQVHTELILYGKTESDAKVTLRGERVKLRKDGTFSFRFALPLGKFEFPVEAVSSSGREKIEITPVVERTKK